MQFSTQIREIPDGMKNPIEQDTIVNMRVPNKDVHILSLMNVCLAPHVVPLLFFCFPKRKVSKIKGDFFCYCSARKKSCSTLLTPFAYLLHALKLLPLLGAIEL